MEKLKQSLFNIIFYIVIIAVIICLMLLVLFAVMKINVAADESTFSGSACIVIDAGHGGEDGGAESADGIAEKGINLAISQALRDYFELSGIKVLMTRDSDMPMGDQSLPTLRERTREDFKERLALFNKENVDCVISIHQNKFTEPQYSGAQVFYSPNDEKSAALAEYIRKSITGLLQPDNQRQNKKADSGIYLLNNCTNPCVLVECGFLSNPEETARLADENYQKQIAFAIYTAVVEYMAKEN